jgi:hypothetical protein
MAETSFVVEVFDPVASTGPERVVVHSENEANAIAADRVKTMLVAMYDFTADRPNGFSWRRYLEMLQYLAAEDGGPLPDIRICAARD